MKYMISWFERPQGSPTEYENTQKRVLEVFGQWKAPLDLKIELFVVRVGEWGGHMLVECADPLLCTSSAPPSLISASKRTRDRGRRCRPRGTRSHSVA
jgi:Protein of unknown function (DUF3303)